MYTSAPLTEERILEIIVRTGSFSVHKYKWGVARTRKMLGKMRRKGLLKIREKRHNSLIYIISEEL